MMNRLLLPTCFALCWGCLLPAQTADDTRLEQVVIFSRHGVRSPTTPNSTLNRYSKRPYPDFGIAPGLVTSNGIAAETILGGYYRLWLTREHLLTGNDAADAAFVYIRANGAETTTKPTAQAFAAGLLPAAGANITQYQHAADPLFDAVGAGVAQFDPRKGEAAVMGRLGGDSRSLASAYAAEYGLTRSLLFNYSPGQAPAPETPNDMVDITAIPIDVAVTGQYVGFTGLASVAAAVDPFLMEYADGMPADAVGWGQLSAAGVSQTMRLHTLGLDLGFRTPYLGKVQSSNVASHVVRTVLQAATGKVTAGSLGTPSSKAIVLFASDANVAGFAGLFQLDWVLPGYPPDFCAPGGAVVFELRQSQSTGEYIVRASYIAQTLDQLRNRTPLTLEAPPAIAPLSVPGCSAGNATFDCPLARFLRVASQIIDPRSADLVN